MRSTVPQWLALTTLAVALGAAAVVSQAAEQITILYTGYGGGAGHGPPDNVVGKADDHWVSLASPIPGDWDVFRTEIYDFPARSMTGTFRFVDTLGNNSLHGRFVGGWEPYGDATHIRTFNNFVIEGGTGIFKGATGIGEDRVYTNFVAGRYVESGILKLTVAAIPEPATMLMFGVGLAGLAARRLRRA
jgi:hypothetical protein